MTSNYLHYLPHHIEPIPVDHVMSAQEQDLQRCVTDARTRPEAYPPHGNAAGATMPPGVPDFQLAGSLNGTAHDHCEFLMGQDKAWVTEDQNMHRGPTGALVWEVGQPIEQAGFHTWRAENVAVGFETADQVVRFWMQEDEAWGWGHRNAILFDDWYTPDDVREAGFGYTNGGPWTHYWTLDMGRRTGPF